MRSHKKKSPLHQWFTKSHQRSGSWIKSCEPAEIDFQTKVLHGMSNDILIYISSIAVYLLSQLFQVVCQQNRRMFFPVPATTEWSCWWSLTLPTDKALEFGQAKKCSRRFALERKASATGKTTPFVHYVLVAVLFFSVSIRSQKKKRDSLHLPTSFPLYIQESQTSFSTSRNGLANSQQFQFYWNHFPKTFLFGPWHKCSDKSAQTDAIRNSGGGINTPSISASAASGRLATSASAKRKKPSLKLLVAPKNWLVFPHRNLRNLKGSPIFRGVCWLVSGEVR